MNDAKPTAERAGTEAVDLPDPARADFQHDPYAAYREVREHGPVVYVPSSGIWLVMGSAEVEAVLRDTERFCNRYNLHADYPLSAECERVLAGSHYAEHAVFNVDPPDHARMRRLLAPYFTRRAVQARAEESREIADDLIDLLVEERAADLLAQFAYRFPMTVVCDLIGIPRDDHRRLKELSNQWVALLVLPLTEEEQVAAAHAMIEYDIYCQDLLNSRGGTGDDVAGGLAAAVQAGECTEGEAVATMRFLLTAGHESTTNLIAHTMHALLVDRRQWEAVLADPCRIPAVVEEGLRFESPIQGMTRQATTDVEIGGTTIPAGARVHVVIGAVARDPDRVGHPDRFDPERRPAGGRHLAFGLGPHFCIGAPLGRAEATVAIEHLARRMPTLRLAPGFTPEYKKGGYIFRGLTRLSVEWDAVRPRVLT